MRTPIRNLALYVSVASALISGSAFAQDRNAYFGQTHQHTSWSLDAYLMGNKVTGPAEAYEYSMGKTIKHPAGYDVKIKTPLDFQGVTDHSEYMGVMRLVNDPSSPIYKLPVSATLRPSKDNPMIKIFQRLAGSLADGKPIESLLDPQIVESVWQNNTEIAEKYNKPGEFTTFCAYEWTSMPQNQNMHRNVFFKSCKGLPAAAIQRDQLGSSRRPVELDGSATQEGYRTAGDIAQRQPVQWAHVSDRT